MAKTFEELNNIAEIIRTNTLPSSNTADLVGGIIKNVIAKILDISNSSDQKITDISMSFASDSTALTLIIKTTINGNITSRSFTFPIASTTTSGILTGAIYKNIIDSITKETTDRTSKDNILQSAIAVLQSLIQSITDGGFHVTDSDGNVVLKYDDNGLDSALLSTHFQGLINTLISLAITSAKGSTLAPLVNSLIPAAYLPSYVDDVIDVDIWGSAAIADYVNEHSSDTTHLSDIVAYDNTDNKLQTIHQTSYSSSGSIIDIIEIGTPESGKVYIDKSSNKTYRWSGTTMVAIGSDLALGETSSTAYAGDKGKQNADNIATLLTYMSANGHTNAFHEDYLYIPDFALSDSIKNLTGVDRFNALKNALNIWLDTVEFVDNTAVGRCKLSVDGMNIECYNYVLSFDHELGVQVVKGAISLSDNKISQGYAMYNIYYRSHNSDTGYGAWTRYGTIVDTALNSTSDNPVANRIITPYITSQQSSISALQALIKSVTDGGFHVTDSDGNVVLKYDDNGLDSALLSTHFQGLINTLISLAITSAKGSTLAPLVNSLIPAAYLPSYVDDVIDVDIWGSSTIADYVNEHSSDTTHLSDIVAYDTDDKKLQTIHQTSYSSSGSIIDIIEIGTPENGKVYIDKSSNNTYRWSGTTMVAIGNSMALGETSSTAYAGDKGKQNATDISALRSLLNTLSATVTTLSSLIAQINEGGFNVTDSGGNVVLKYDTNGLDAAELSTHLISIIKGIEGLRLVIGTTSGTAFDGAKGSQLDTTVKSLQASMSALQNIVTIDQEAFVVCDQNGYVIYKIDASGIDFVSISSHATSVLKNAGIGSLKYQVVKTIN